MDHARLPHSSIAHNKHLQNIKSVKHARKVYSIDQGITEGRTPGIKSTMQVILSSEEERISQEFSIFFSLVQIEVVNKYTTYYFWSRNLLLFMFSAKVKKSEFLSVKGKLKAIIFEDQIFFFHKLIFRVKTQLWVEWNWHTFPCLHPSKLWGSNIIFFRGKCAIIHQPLSFSGNTLERPGSIGETNLIYIYIRRE